MSLDVNIEPEEFNTSELHGAIQDAAKRKGIEEFDYQVEFACDKGENYVANLFRVLIRECDSDKKVSVIVKTLVNTTRQELFHELHKREVYVYKEVIPLYKTIQENFNSEQRITLPECLFTSVEKGREILILDDLIFHGFVTDDKLAKFEKLDYLQVRVVLKELAKFHALSYALENKHPDVFKRLSKELKDILFEDSFLNKSKLRSYFIDSYKASLKVVTAEEARKKLEKLEPKLLQVLKNFVQPGRYNVLCHGDCWINNILFKHEEKKQTQVCLIDFQAMRYANPTLDIIYFLYICTDSQFRSEHFDTLQNVYYESLKHCLNLHGIDINVAYPRKEFFKDIKENLPFGLLMALIEMRIVTSEGDDGKNSTIYKSCIDISMDDTESGIDSDERLFSIRINDVIQESIVNGVLTNLLEK